MNSTERYKVSVECLDAASTPENRLLVPKRVSTTWWSFQADACKALVQNYAQIKSTLEEMSEGNVQAQGLYNQMSKLETGIYAELWHTILERVNSINKKLQYSDADLNTSINYFKSLKSFIQEQRDLFNNFEKE